MFLGLPLQQFSHLVLSLVQVAPIYQTQELSRLFRLHRGGQFLEARYVTLGIGYVFRRAQEVMPQRARPGSSTAMLTRYSRVFSPKTRQSPICILLYMHQCLGTCMQYCLGFFKNFCTEEAYLQFLRSEFARPVIDSLTWTVQLAKPSETHPTPRAST